MNNKIPSIRIIYNRYKKATSTTKASVELVITYDSKQKYISTGVMLYPNQWKKGIITNCPDALEISQTLDKLVKNVRQIILNMMNEGHIDIFAIPDKLDEMNSPKMSFLDFCEERARIRKYGMTRDSQIRYERFLRFFRDWGKIKHFEDVTDSNILNYEEYLKDKGLKDSSKWNNYHRFLNSFILDAIDAGYLTKNPYRWINVSRKREDSLSKCLNIQEFNRIKTVNLPTEKLSRVRDLFVFQTYTCLSYTDLSDFDYHAIQKIKGIDVYIGCRHKTTTPFTIPLLPTAISILEKYRGVLPIISNVKYNEYLKLVAQAAGVDKPISTHWARHTGATLLLNEGIPMEIVSKICGHSSIKITEQIYAKILDETVVEAIKEKATKL